MCFGLMINEYMNIIIRMNKTSKTVMVIANARKSGFLNVRLTLPGGSLCIGWYEMRS